MDADTVDGRTMFEGISLISSERSGFQSRYIETNIAYDPLDIGNARYFRERTAEQAADIYNDD
ncbi:hypothetical protein [Gynuella sp.]|uniref:hypothetical protein n=1 Tax=Gynuella sp. TaxID=2969146 RepID=UPI003D0C045D